MSIYRARLRNTSNALTLEDQQWPVDRHSSARRCCGQSASHAFGSMTNDHVLTVINHIWLILTQMADQPLRHFVPEY